MNPKLLALEALQNTLIAHRLEVMRRTDDCLSQPVPVGVPSLRAAHALAEIVIREERRQLRNIDRVIKDVNALISGK